jgi:hypothetical protein
MLYNQPIMTEGQSENPIGERLRNLSITELSQATNNLLSLLKNRNPDYFPSAANKEGLVLIARRYLEEYSPLLREWERRQNEREYRPDLHQKLQGQIPDETLNELRELEKRQATSLDWKPQEEGRRLTSLQKIRKSYNDGGLKIPYPWLNFFLENKEQIKQTVRELERKQSGEGLTGEETLILNFLQRSGVGEILKD